MRVVLDTNVVVSGVLQPSSVPARVLSLVHESRVRPVIDGRIMEEYKDVLARPRLRIPEPFRRTCSCVCRMLRNMSS